MNTLAYLETNSKRLFQMAAYGQRVRVQIENIWGDLHYSAVLVDKFQSSDGIAVAKLLRMETGATEWVTAESIVALGSMTTIRYVNHISGVMGLPVIIDRVNVWHWNGQPIDGIEGEIEAVAVDYDGDYVLCYIEGQRDFARYHRKFVTIHEEALFDTDYDLWLDELDSEWEAAIS